MAVLGSIPREGRRGGALWGPGPKRTGASPELQHVYPLQGGPVLVPGALLASLPAVAARGRWL